MKICPNKAAQYCQFKIPISLISKWLCTSLEPIKFRFQLTLPSLRTSPNLPLGVFRKQSLSFWERVTKLVATIANPRVPTKLMEEWVAFSAPQQKILYMNQHILANLYVFRHTIKQPSVLIYCSLDQTRVFNSFYRPKVYLKWTLSLKKI